MQALTNRVSSGLLAKVSTVVSVCLLTSFWGAYVASGITSIWAVLGIFAAILVGIFVVNGINEAAGAKFGFPALLVWCFGLGAMSGPGLHQVVAQLGFQAVAFVFLISTAIMVVFGTIGAFTSRNLSSWGPFLLNALLGLIVVQLVLIFLPGLTWANLLAGIAGALLFVGYFIYDFNQAARDENTWQAAVRHSMSIVLDFWNEVWSLLQIYMNAK